MFQFPAFPLITLFIHVMMTDLYSQPGFPIRTSACRQIFAPLRSFSQLITSFVGFRCQGIHPALLIAWPFATSCFSALSRFRFLIVVYLYTLVLFSIKVFVFPSLWVDFPKRYHFCLFLLLLYVTLLVFFVFSLLHFVIWFSRYKFHKSC